MKVLSRAAWSCSRTAARSFSATCRNLRRAPATQAREAENTFNRYVPGFRSDTLRETLDVERTSKNSAGSSRSNDLFASLVERRWELVRHNMGRWTVDHPTYRSFGIHSEGHLSRECKLFLQAVMQSLRSKAVGRNTNPLFWNLRNAFIRGDVKELDRELRYSFQSFVLRSQFSNAVTDSHIRLADFREPYDWFPATRMMQRTVHLHVGPTNSGKTYTALKALENARTGIYAGPLRLLAHEVYSRFKAKGKPCALVTGEEQRIPEGVDEYFSSCTVEMTPLNQRVDVAVIDEIQMIADSDRGWAWTQAVLGVQAKELHLCGEERSVNLIKQLCAMTGDKCIVHEYKRLSPLKTMNRSLEGDFSRLQKGDCVVCFSRITIHRMKAGIEQLTGRRCAMVYGSLPPETRAQQAALFNDPDNDYDFLVASDAIGMGLNLEIKRVIFETTTKFDGVDHRALRIPEMKQIGGRAGRYRTARQEMQGVDAADGASAPAPSVGLVTALDEEDLPALQEAFTQEADPLKTAVIFPPVFIIERFYSYFPPETPFSFILSRLRELAKLSPHFNMADFSDRLVVADAIQEIPMSIYDRCVFLTIPVSLRDFKQTEVLQSLARAIGSNTSGHLLDIEDLDLEILELNREDVDGHEYLMRLEALHKALTMYLWLTYRYQGIFCSQALAFHTKSLVEEKITDYLEHLNFVPEDRRKLRQSQRARAEAHAQREAALLGDEPHEDEPVHEGPGVWGEEPDEEPLGDEIPTPEELPGRASEATANPAAKREA
ncbi:P-loop containing nucleoside triphosphate hydrolase protein [Coniochaeta sp. 2T2.1]|nr:P-loop containing nucleoside triphosphate hydrolase protein [Coniochaeta sp. 2T2.1]